MSAPVSSTAPVVTPAAAPSLYVGDLSSDITESLLYDIFNAVGPVASVRVCRDAATRRSLGYAYVNFHRIEDAERALDTLNFTNIKNRPCRIMWCHRDPTLRKTGQGNIFINHLDKSIDNKQLAEYFSIFGNILSCKVSTRGAGESLGYGFVHFEAEESAVNAIAKVDGKMIAGKKVSVAPFKSKKERGSVKSFTNVFVKNLPAETTKEQLHELFAAYGTINSSIISIGLSDPKNARAHGFVNFETAEQAAAAVEALNNSNYQGKPLYVARAQKKDEREKELRDRFEQRKIERQKKNAGVNLYIKYLQDTIDDERLRTEFSKYGSITNAKIMRDEKGNSKGFGFVCFSAPEEATRAVTEMNGKMLEGKPLYVGLHQRKDQRRAAIEMQLASRQRGGSNMPIQSMAFPPQAGPMMYQGMPPRNMMYPQQFPGVPRQFRGPQVMPMRGPQPINYQLMPMQRPMPMGQPMGQPNQQRRQNNNRPRQQAAPGARTLPNGQVANAAYPNQRRPQSASGSEAAKSPAPMDPSQPLTAQLLASSTPEMQKQLIGERLYTLIKAQEPELAGKITGMLLEMDNSELLLLLESPQALSEKITEALQVLNSADESN